MDTLNGTSTVTHARKMDGVTKVPLNQNGTHSKCFSLSLWVCGCGCGCVDVDVCMSMYLTTQRVNQGWELKGKERLLLLTIAPMRERERREQELGEKLKPVSVAGQIKTVGSSYYTAKARERERKHTCQSMRSMEKAYKLVVNVLFLHFCHLVHGFSLNSLFPSPSVPRSLSFFLSSSQVVYWVNCEHEKQESLQFLFGFIHELSSFVLNSMSKSIFAPLSLPAWIIMKVDLWVEFW